MSIHVKITYKQYLEFLDLTFSKVDELHQRKKKYMKDYYVDTQDAQVMKFNRLIERFEKLHNELEVLEISED